jgi:predicted acylesterase/phospholipase RssA/CRP-like cAMP-binding protein
VADDVLALLSVHEFFRAAPAEAREEAVRQGTVHTYPAAALVHEADQPLTNIGFVLRGRLKAVRVDARGTETLFRIVERGEQFGLMIGAVAEPVPIRVVALEPTTVLLLDFERGIELTFRYPELRRAWLSAFARSLRKHFFGAARKRTPAVLALIHEAPVTHLIAERLLDRLCAVNERLIVFGDPERWRDRPGARLVPLPADGRAADIDEIRRQAAAAADVDRIVFDVPVGWGGEHAARLVELADRVIYFVPSGAAERAVARLRALDVAGRGWRDKIAVAWLLEGDSPVGPAVPALQELTARDFKIATAQFAPPHGRVPSDGLERLVHDLRGVRIGVALGGGAARGMSHLGVLKALEQQGIVVDMIAGTSAGAMTGVVYASGLDCDYSANRFARDLRPGWLFRRFPSGPHWYLLYKYRRGHFDPMLRKYLHDWRLEQLAIPCLTVTVDLVSGCSVVRDRGDATHAVLESINLPVLSVPIVRQGQALIDGGLVNNIPADVLVSAGCNFVIAVSVSAKMEKEFCAITPETQVPSGRKPTVVQTLLRSLLVQNHSLNARGVQPADVVIETDVRGFDLTAFTRAEDMAARGEAAGREAGPRIRELLARLDPQLFAPAAPGP